MNKLEFYSITGKFKTLINSYLTGVQQSGSNKSSSDNVSDWEIIKVVPLKALFLFACFFLLYINDLPKIINKDNNMIHYADDRSILIKDSNKLNFRTNLNETFNKINTLFNGNLLTLNLKKTQYLEF
jgi:hypothetical protein